MGSVKVAVSLPEELFTQVEAVAAEMKVPRSRVYASALEEYVRRIEDRRFTEAIDAAYAEPDPEHEVRMEAYKAARRRVMDLEGPEDWGA